MRRVRRGRIGSVRGFSLVELLAVVLILAVLAMVAIPLYTNTRGSSAARTCKANIKAVAAAEAAFALLHGQYCRNPMASYNAADPTSGGLVGAPQGLAGPVYCPQDDSAYRISGGGSGEALTISCPHCLPANGGDGRHGAYLTSPAGTDEHSITLAKPAQER